MFKEIFKKKKNEWEKKSYSQCGEDLIVKYIFDTVGIEKPSYLDIGAHHPFYLNNTAIFYISGSKGVNVEPDPILFKEFEKYRLLDCNLNLGISNKESVENFYVINVPTLNTFSKEEADNYSKEGNFYVTNTLKVEVVSVDSLLKNHCKGIFPDFLTIDAEGIDKLVIESIDFRNNFPKVICIETISFSQTGKGIKNNEIINFLKDNNYMLYADTYVNSIFVNKDIWNKW